MGLHLAILGQRDKNRNIKKNTKIKNKWQEPEEEMRNQLKQTT